MLAVKFFEDIFYDNAYYARVGGIPALEMNALELEFLFLINFSLHVQPAEFETYYSDLVREYHAISSPGKEREGGGKLLL